MRLNQCPLKAGPVQFCAHFQALDFRICADGEKRDRVAAKKQSQPEMGDGLFSLTFKRVDPHNRLKNQSQDGETEADSDETLKLELHLNVMENGADLTAASSEIVTN